MSDKQPCTIKRVISCIDEAMPIALFHQVTKWQADQIPLEIEDEDGMHYQMTGTYLVPALIGSLLYSIGVYTEIIKETQP